MASGEYPDVFQYDNLPQPLRVQIIHVWDAAFGIRGKPGGYKQTAFDEMSAILCKEYGIFQLASGYRGSSFEEFTNWFLDEKDMDRCLDAIELTCRFLSRIVSRGSYKIDPSPQQAWDNAIAEINVRLRDAGVGYQYESEEIIRVDSQLLHSEVVLPALRFLSDPAFAGANKEFLAAHQEYRSQKYGPTVVECLKAFESTLKIICDQRGWAYSPNDTAKKLIEIVFANKLIPGHLQSQFSSLRSLLESGIPTIRNKHGGHGQGRTDNAPPDFLAAYQLHQTAAALVMLVRANEDFQD